MMVEVNDGTGLQYLLTDHLGSTVAIINASGTLTSQQRYLPFGAPRAIPNSPILGTDFTYTGQRNLSGTGLMDYRARMYSVTLGKFIQPDTIIPSTLNPQSWNRYSYVMNRPIVLNDPSGHCPICLIAVIVIGSIVLTGDTPQPVQPPTLVAPPTQPTIPAVDSNKNGVPETADPKMQPISLGTGPNCIGVTYTECFYQRDRFSIDGNIELDKEQLGQLELAIYYDLKKRDKSINDRANYDTPFWNGYDEPGEICVDSMCYPRSEVNYLAQGMYAASQGEPIGGWSVLAWKSYNYFFPDFKGDPRIGLPPTPPKGTYKSPIPSAGTMYWFNQGYDAYEYLESKLGGMKAK